MGAVGGDEVDGDDDCFVKEVGQRNVIMKTFFISIGDGIDDADRLNDGLTNPVRVGVGMGILVLTACVGVPLSDMPLRGAPLSMSSAREKRSPQNLLYSSQHSS